MKSCIVTLVLLAAAPAVAHAGLPQSTLKAAAAANDCGCSGRGDCLCPPRYCGCAKCERPVQPGSSVPAQAMLGTVDDTPSAAKVTYYPMPAAQPVLYYYPSYQFSGRMGYAQPFMDAGGFQCSGGS